MYSNFYDFPFIIDKTKVVPGPIAAGELCPDCHFTFRKKMSFHREKRKNEIKPEEP